MSGPPCRCGRPSAHLVASLASDGSVKRTRHVCADEECEWKAHCALLGIPYQNAGRVASPEGSELPP